MSRIPLRLLSDGIAIYRTLPKTQLVFPILKQTRIVDGMILINIEMMFINKPEIGEVMSNFEFLSVLFAIIIGIGFAHLLLSIGRILGEAKSLNVGSVQVIWTVNVLLVLVTYWWWLVNLRTIEEWVFLELLILLFHASLWVLLAATLFPVTIPLGYDLKAHFETKRTSFFGILILVAFADPLTAMIVGTQHLSDLGWQYLHFIVVCLVGGIAGIRFNDERFQKVLALYWGFSLINVSLSPGIVLDLYNATP